MNENDERETKLSYVLMCIHEIQNAPKDIIWKIGISLIGLASVGLLSYYQLVIPMIALLVLSAVGTFGLFIMHLKTFNPDSFMKMMEEEDVEVAKNVNVVAHCVKYIKTHILVRAFLLAVGVIETWLLVEYGKMPEIAALWLSMYIVEAWLYVQSNDKVNDLKIEYGELTD